MNTEHLTDLALQKRATARSYVRRRHALRKAVALGLPAEMVREVVTQVAELKATWRAARELLKPAKRWDSARSWVDIHCPLYPEG